MLFPNPKAEHLFEYEDRFVKLPHLGVGYNYIKELDV